MRPKIDIFTLLDQLPYRRRKEKEKKVQLDWKAEWERFDAKKLFEFDLAAISEKELSAIRKRKEVIMDGNYAALSILTRVVDGLCGYPITPSTPIAENFASLASQGQKNLFGSELMYFQPSDELSAIAAVEAMASQGGRYVDNSSSQGLVLKTKNLFSVAGKRLPVVMTIMAREVNKGSLSIHCGHTDFYGVRNTGWAQLVAGDNQELHDLLPVAFKTAELRQVMLPCMVIGDGFIKSHALENIKVFSDDFLRYFVGPPNRLYQPDFEEKTLTGTFTKGGGMLPHRRCGNGGCNSGIRSRCSQGYGRLLPGCEGGESGGGAPCTFQPSLFSGDCLRHSQCKGGQCSGTIRHGPQPASFSGHTVRTPGFSSGRPRRQAGA
jgi:pyruvate-ferredoxin/flavodoxin oxidoreductase